jgi:hypothetical protein
MAANGFAADEAQAQSEAPWQFGVTVPLWGAGIDGNATILGHQQDVNVSFSQLKDHLKASFGLALNAQKGKFGLSGDVGYMEFSGAFAGPLGGNTSADLKFVMANAGVSYLLVKTGEEHPFLLAGTAGIRYWHTDTSLTFRGPRGVVNLNGGQTKDLVQPVLGLRGSQYLTPKLHLDFSGDIGGFDINNKTDWTWSAAGLATYDFRKWLSLSAGYKALGLDESNGSGASKNGLNIVMHGPLILVTIKF